MKIGELFQRCAFDAIDQLGQRICTEHDLQLPDYREESDILHYTRSPQTGVPSGLKEIDGRWYLFGFDREIICAFSTSRI